MIRVTITTFFDSSLNQNDLKISPPDSKYITIQFRIETFAISNLLKILYKDYMYIVFCIEKHGNAKNIYERPR